ncbi:CaiB/BaiF CoA-transferase family protein [Frateuria aurantia]
MSNAAPRSDSPDEPVRPLAGLRVIELPDGKTGMCGRLLAELGAEIILLEPPGGSQHRHAAPTVAETSLQFEVQHVGKSSVEIDLETTDGRRQFEQLLNTAQLLIAAGQASEWPHANGGLEHLRTLNPDLVVLSITDFGLTGPYRNFLASHSVQIALGGVLCRSGLPGREPLLPPGRLAYEAAAVQAAWCALLGHWQSLQRDVGDLLDFSIFEATAQVIDPALGPAGSAAAGLTASRLRLRDRPPAVPLYPIFPCRDGYVRICVLAPRQWLAMSNWLGENHRFSDPAYAQMGRRLEVIDQINALIAAHFLPKTRTELVAEGRSRGLPIAALATPGEVLADPHFAARKAFSPWVAAIGITGRIPASYLEIDRQRPDIRPRAPWSGEHSLEVLARLPRRAQSNAVEPATPTPPHRPLEGIRVLDMGVIVAGAETSRLLADQGAEVIKIECSAFPDGSRQTLHGAAISESFALGHRGAQSFGINLKNPQGLALFKQLVAVSDVLLSNFKPGTLQSLGLDYDELKRIQPGLIVADSSALGHSGPDSRSMGYGPLVRAATGLTGQWRYPDSEGGFSDGITIFPDHFVARVVATGVLALLIRRRRTRRGGQVSVSQAECILMAYSADFLHESLRAGSFSATCPHPGLDVPDGIYPCAGDNEWCAISVTSHPQWKALVQIIWPPDETYDDRLDHPEERMARRAYIDDIIINWTSRHDPRRVTDILQAAGIPAGYMQRPLDYATNPQMQARRFVRELVQPGLDTPLQVENSPVQASSLPEPEIRPAPLPGEHTREIASHLLGLTNAQIDALLDAGALESPGDISGPPP